MRVKLRTTLKSQWYWQLTIAVLVSLLMASLAHAELKPDDTLYDEWPELVGTWGPMMKLRDNTDTWAARKPDGGWWVGLIHATLLPDGKIIATAISRREEKRVFEGGDQANTAGENSVSFVLDPSELRQNPKDTIYVRPIREDAEFPEGGAPGPGKRDYLFCSGHAPIGNGRILFTGGTQVTNLAQPDRKPEQGLTYARLFDPKVNEFSMVQSRNGEIYRMAGDGRYKQMWYNTTIRLPEGKALIFGGFWEGRYDRPYSDNLGFQIFDPEKLKHDQNPFSLLVAHEDSVPYLKISETDYAAMVVLPQPLTIAETTYEVAVIAESGHIVLLDVEPSSKKRFHVLTHRPSGNCPHQSGRRVSFLLSPAGKELIVVGGYKDSDIDCDVSRRADFYHLEHHAWYSLDLGIARPFPTTTVLPTGVVLIANGGPIRLPIEKRQPPGEPGTDITLFPKVTHVQILDPERYYAYDLGPWSDDPSARGYHGMALLMKDASVLIGGGLSLDGSYGIGSERPDIRFYEPYYLHHQRQRPEWGDVQEPIAMTVGKPIRIPYSGPDLKEEGGVALMALGSYTHSFDHNQRYIPLDYKRNGDMLEITAPANTFIAPQGDYMLYLVGPSDLADLPEEGPVTVNRVRDFGMPSVGKHVVLN
ncbi:galactose oxidase early set domain-containing protein [Candidatus Entotheonella palauensis]|uniref:Galactose oxidase-like Early set domain-containing protein n=1 Tax=Candidatus Entotheonella gemina TaxID=1429439 RepID=W4MA55_9BACT|nr:galactose oxidase early set domain-containing protein [Candidatus Entotheonella palauensis]ETX07070.1 MAG: hypothetical protein ETSY2_13305 [Candidatus Entotheonella gemina]